jgi:4-alpha-glucanotransferase
MAQAEDMKAIAEGSIVRDALRRLGVERLVLSVHHSSFPASDDDLGHGSPASARGRDFVSFVADLGFTGISLGPAGMVSGWNPSPYDGTVLARNPMALSFRGLVPDAELDAWVLPPSERADQDHAEQASRRLLAAFARGGGATRAAEVWRWAASRPWMARELALEADPFTFALGQMTLEAQHDEVRRHARSRGLAVIADAQVGMSPRDRERREALFLDGWALGAPPSRTNPEGQPWGYPVLDPRALGEGGAGRAFFLERIDELLAHHDGLRIDHAHGWVCPWVYAGEVRDGARLHESPDLPGLAPFARVREEQLARELPRHHDEWVRWLEPSQVDAYAALFDLVVARADARGLARVDVMAEVLSTCPRPLAAVLARHGLGRFRVTQKAKLADAADVYRADRARPEDWVMVGNHDTPPLALVVDRWQGTDELGRRAAYLAGRLGGEASELVRDPAALREAMLADLFLGPARNVLVYWVDLFEGRALFNDPGVISPDNWRLRVPPRFEASYGGILGRAARRALAARERL